MISMAMRSCGVWIYDTSGYFGSGIASKSCVMVQAVTSRVNNAKLSVSGRNLIWWTDFRGGDPEAQNFGAGNVPDAVQRNRELAAYPASKSYWLNLSVDF